MSSYVNYIIPGIFLIIGIGLFVYSMILEDEHKKNRKKTEKDIIFSVGIVLILISLGIILWIYKSSN